MASGGEKVPKSAQEGVWRDLGAKNDEAKDVKVFHLEALGRPLGSSGASWRRFFR